NGRGKPHREGSEAAQWDPAARPDQLIIGGSQRWRIGGVAEWRLGEIAEPDHRLGPGGWLVGVAATGGPQNGASLFGQFAGKSMVDTDKAVGDEGIDLRLVKRGRSARHCKNP